MSMCRRALGRPPARHKCWLLTFSSAVLCWHRLTLHFPLLFNYSIIGIPEVLQFTVRLLEGETHKHRRTWLHTLAFFPTHALAHAQEARMASVGWDVGARCGFRFHVRAILNFSPWNTILFAVRLITSEWFSWLLTCAQKASRLCKYVWLLFTRTHAVYMVNWVSFVVQW